MTFLRHFFFASFLLITLGAGINYAADPFDIFGMPVIERFNTHKSIGLVRFAKPLQVVARQPDVVLLGTSRVAAGIDPDSISNGNAYNLAMAGMLVDEMAAYSHHVLTETAARKLIIGVDFVAFNDRRNSRDAFEIAVLGENTLLRTVPKTLLSYAALRRTRDTIRNSIRKKPTEYRRNGFHPYSKNVVGRDLDAILTPVGLFLAPGGGYRDFTGTKKKAEVFKDMLNEARSRGADVEVFIPPIHAAQMDMIDHAGLWPLFEEWKRALVTICEAAGISLWDFSNYNRMTTKPLADIRQTHSDSSHFWPEIGDLILQRMAGAGEPKDFGVILKPQTIDQDLIVAREARRKYRIQHRNDFERVRDLSLAALAEN